MRQEAVGRTPIFGDAGLWDNESLAGLSEQAAPIANPKSPPKYKQKPSIDAGFRCRFEAPQDCAAMCNGCTKSGFS